MLTRFRDFDRAFSPFDLLAREMDRAFAEVDRQGSFGPQAEWPRINVFEDERGFVLQAEIPGAQESDVQLTVEDDVVTLSGARKIEPPSGYTVRLRERARLSFERKLTFGARIDAEAVNATMKDGVLTVTLPKAKEALRRQIAVRAS